MARAGLVGKTRGPSYSSTFLPNQQNSFMITDVLKSIY